MFDKKVWQCGVSEHTTDRSSEESYSENSNEKFEVKSPFQQKQVIYYFGSTLSTSDWNCISLHN